MTPELLIALISAAGTLIASIIAVVALIDARKARRGADSASVDANKALARSASADEAAADALQSLAAIAAATVDGPLPEPKVAWTVGYHGGDLQFARNSGSAVAYDARVVGGQGILADEDSERDELRPGQTLIFGVMPRGFGGSRRDLTIEWRIAPDGKKFTADYSVSPNR